MGGQYGPYVMYFLSQLLQKRQAAEVCRQPDEDNDKDKVMDKEKEVFFYRRRNRGAVAQE